MRIYNYLFYKSYQLAQHSRNFDDMPAVGAIIFVVVCLMFNIFAIIFFLEGLGLIGHFAFNKEYKYIFSLFLVVLVLIYYLYKGRYKKIIEHYEQKNGNNVQLHPIIVIVIYYVISFFIGMLAAMYKNQDWIFK